MRYLIAGAFSKSISIIKFITSRLADASDIVVYDGINKCSWNGGRINRDVYYTDTLIDYYYSKDIKIALTLSNHNINLDDEVGNHLLKKFHRKGNALIIVNDDLRKYVRENFPKYELIHSITGMGLLNIPLQDSDVAFYQQLEKDYDWIVPRFEHIFDPRNIELDKTKWEVMVNDTCVYGCKYFDEHFKAIANENTAGRPYSKEVEECWLPKFDPNIPSKHNCMDIDAEHIQKLKDMGVRSFKITGREMDDDELLGDIIRYVKRSVK
jgi:collagenase-like PrtC family protease